MSGHAGSVCHGVPLSVLQLHRLSDGSRRSASGGVLVLWASRHDPKRATAREGASHTHRLSHRQPGNVERTMTAPGTSETCSDDVRGSACSGNPDIERTS